MRGVTKLPTAHRADLAKSRQLDRGKIHPSARLVDAMQSLNESGMEIVLVTDDDDRLAGIVTDGDVRRALLQGATLESPVAQYMQRQFVAVSPAAGRAEVLDIMQARTISGIPIIDPDRRLLGVHLLHEVLGKLQRPNWAVVMAGGRGTRLGPMTENTPKPMLRVAGRPILERIVLHLVGYGITRIFLSINYLGHIIEQHFGDGSRFGCRIQYLRETRPLGTGGALSLLPEMPSDPVIVMNGDLVTQVDIADMLAFHKDGGHKMTVGARQYAHTVPFGCLEVNNHRIVDIEEKPKLVKLVNAGIYILDPELLHRVPKETEFSLPSLIEQCVADNTPVAAFEVEDDWIDVGQREQLKAARVGA